MASTDPFFNAASQVRSEAAGQGSDGQTRTERDTQEAQDRTLEDTQRAQDQTEGGTGADKLNRRIAAQENPQQEQILYTELQTGLTTPQLASFAVIICVDGEPWNATINGAITGEVT